MEFTFALNVPVLAAIAASVLFLLRYFKVIILALNKVNELSTAHTIVAEKVDQHDRDIAALQAVSIGYGRHSARQAMRDRD